LSSPTSKIEEVKLAGFEYATNVGTGPAKGYVQSEHPEFFAPELYRMQPHGRAVDMWSLGVLLYVLLSGNLPFSPRNRLTMRRLIRNAKFDFDMKSWRESTGEAQNLIKSLLNITVLKRLNAEQTLRKPWVSITDLETWKNDVTYCGCCFSVLQTNLLDQDLKNIDLTSKIAAYRKFNIRQCFRRAIARAMQLARSEDRRLSFIFQTLRISAPVTPRGSPMSPKKTPPVSETLREKALSSLSDVDADVDDLTFEEKYTLLEDQELGQGAFATVFRGALIRNGKSVAIKVVDRTHLSPTTEEIMKSEAEILKTLNHRYVIRCHDYYLEPARFIIVMELVEGGDLLTRLARKTVYSEKDARDLTEILLSAVNHCHQHDIVHRDLKLENLLLVSDRDDNMIKLADFGLAAKATNETSLNGFCGTPGYVAPEILDLRLYGKSVDIWSAGVIVFALLGGYLPFEAESILKYKQACAQPLYFEPEFWAEVSIEAKDLITHLLDVDVKQRYTAAQALRHPWLKKSGSVLARRSLQKTLSQIKQFNLHRKFKAIAHSLIAHAKFMRRLNFGRAQSERAKTDVDLKDEPKHASEESADEEDAEARIAAMNAALNKDYTAPPSPVESFSRTPPPTLPPTPPLPSSSFGHNSPGALSVLTAQDDTLVQPTPLGSARAESVRYDSKYGDLGVIHLDGSDITPSVSPTAFEMGHRKKSVSFVSQEELAAERMLAALAAGSDNNVQSQVEAALQASPRPGDDDPPPVKVAGPSPVAGAAHIGGHHNYNTDHGSPPLSAFSPIPVLPPRPAIVNRSSGSTSSVHSTGAGSPSSYSPPVNGARSPSSTSPVTTSSSASTIVGPVIVETVSTVSADPNHIFKNMYVIQNHLGRGGFGHVFKANRRDKPEEIVAVKVLERASLSPHDEHRIREESGILQSLKHPNIIEFYDFFEEAKIFVIIMEYLDGGELFHRIAKKLYYNEETARNLVRDLLNGVKYCHDRDIVHRDIKAENIIMANKVDDDKIKLIDFGLAGRASGLTLEGYVGTPGYLPPEVMDFKSHGKPVDMWSIGVITYILLGGYMPFDMRDMTKGRMCVRNAIYEFPDDYWNDVSGDAKNFIAKLLVVDVAKRLTIDQALSHPWV
jgi:calcium/calmodulin-dependent protein kinase I